MTEPTPTETTTSGRNLFLLVGGLAVLGIGLAFLIFGGELFSSPASESELTSFAPAQETNTLAEPPAAALGQVQVGDTAPDFVLEDLDGNPVALSDFEGRPVMVNFWATWCAPCRIEMPEFEAAYANYAPDGLEILAVNNMETPEQVDQFFNQEFGLSFVPLLDSEGEIAENYGVFNMPTTFFVNGEGEVVIVHRGPIAQALLEEYLAETFGG